MTSVKRYVYFAKAGNMMKIGSSVRPLERLAAISEWIPFKMELAATLEGGLSLEAAFHSYFEDYWSHGEWFHISPKMDSVIADILAGKDINIPAARPLRCKLNVTKLKHQATRRITRAENNSRIPHNYPRNAIRPQYLKDAMAAYEGSGSPAPDDYVLAAISQYERELKAKQ